jgi:hypothetical protein
MHTPQLSQTVCTAIQLALVVLLKEWNVAPVAVVGHSSGIIFPVSFMNFNSQQLLYALPDLALLSIFRYLTLLGTCSALSRFQNSIQSSQEPEQ